MGLEGKGLEGKGLEGKGLEENGIVPVMIPMAEKSPASVATRPLRRATC